MMVDVVTAAYPDVIRNNFMELQRANRPKRNRLRVTLDPSITYPVDGGLGVEGRGCGGASHRTPT